ncbi:MAG: tyrosine-type recombinase/integrase [Afipia sp.]|nr:tyrosine-type recombinase/integrase [Afipia sp.]
MSVFRVKNSPYYQFDFQIKGHRFYGSTEERNERKAKEVETAKRAEAKRIVDDAVATGRRPLTVEVACDNWWSEVGQHGSDPDLKRALDWLKGQIGPRVALHDITDSIVTAAVEARRKHVKRSGRDANGKQLFKPLSNRTVNKTVTSLLSRVFTRAKENWNATILREPDWRKHWLPERKRPIREITAAEEKRIDAVESKDFAELREFAALMGLRRKELLLRWPQVDFDMAVIRIIGKGGKPATIPLPRRAYEILWGLRGNHETSVFTFVAERTRKCPKTEVKFVKGDRYPMTYFGIGTNRRRKWAKAGVDARLHDLRHTTGMRTLRTTGNLKLVQKLLRHTDIKTTSQFYTDADLDDIRAGMEATAKSTESQKKSQTENLDAANNLKDKA